MFARRLLCGLLTLMSMISSSAAQDANVVQQIKKTWSEREQELPIFTLTIREKQFCPKGGQSGYVWQAGFLKKTATEDYEAVLPVKDQEFNWTTRYLVAGERFRLETTDVNWAFDESAFVARPMITVRNGRGTTSSFYPSGLGGDEPKTRRNHPQE